MASNTFGEFFRITTFGESHGKAIGVIIDGVIPNIDIDEHDIQKELDRRKPGQSKVTTPRKEDDKVQILSGVFEGKTTGAPICLLIWNKDQNPSVYKKYQNIFRPGHAGYTYLQKYGIYDYFGGGRASGRETASRVAAGSIAKKILDQNGLKIFAYTKQVGNITCKRINLDEIEKNPIRCPDATVAIKMENLIKKVKKEGDSIGGVVEILIKNCPIGLGDPAFEKLHSELGKALLSIGAVKGFEIGEGFKCSSMRGSEYNDQFYFSKQDKRVRTKTNNQGGILAGISNGEDIICRIAVKPTSSILIEQNTVDFKLQDTKITIEGRHDPCLCPRIVPVAESMVALVLLDRMIMQAMIKNENDLTSLRDKIDIIDRNILFLLSYRNKVSKEIGLFKLKNDLPIFDQKREKKVLKEKLNIASKIGLEKSFIEQIYENIFKVSKNIQKELK